MLDCDRATGRGSASGYAPAAGATDINGQWSAALWRVLFTGASASFRRAGVAARQEALLAGARPNRMRRCLSNVLAAVARLWGGRGEAAWRGSRCRAESGGACGQPMLLVVRVSQLKSCGYVDVVTCGGWKTTAPSSNRSPREQDHEGPAPGFLCGPANNVLLPPWRERDRLVRWLASRLAAWRGRAAAWWAGRQARQLRVGHCLALWSGGGGCGEAEAVNCSVEGCNCKQDHRRGWPDPRIARPVRNRSARASRQQRSIEVHMLLLSEALLLATRTLFFYLSFLVCL